jgi:hypothetical protein
MKKSLVALLLVLPVLALAAPADNIHDVSADSLRLFPRGLAAFLTNRGIDYADTYLRLRVKDSTGAVVRSTGLFTEIPGLTSVRLSYDIGGYEMATYVARCSVDYDEDENRINDTASLRIVPPLCDVGMDFWIWPLGSVDSGETGHPCCHVRNFGDSCADFFLLVRIDSTFSDSLFVESLPAGEGVELEFHDEWQALLVGWHPTLCSLAYPFFHAWAHAGSIYVQPSGAGAEQKPRHEPEPVRLVPETGGFVLNGPAHVLEHVLVFDPTGRMLAVSRHRKSGRLHVSGLSPGVYFVSGEDFRHKLVLAH